MGHVNIDLFRFPDEFPEDEIQERLTMEYAAEGGYAMGTPVCIGRVAQDPSRTYTHGAVSRFEDGEFWDKMADLYAEVLHSSDDAVGPAMSYHAKRWTGLRVVDFDDPYLVEHGVSGWSERLSKPLLDLARKDKRVADVLTALYFTFVNNGNAGPRTAEAWAREALGIPFSDAEWA